MTAVSPEQVNLTSC